MLTTTSNIKNILFLFAVFLPHFLLSQNTQTVLKKIKFEGLKKTKTDYLSRFLDTRVGEVVDLKTLEKDIQRLRNLPAIAKADFLIDSTSELGTLTFQIEEALTLFPIINFGGIRGNFWYQAGFNDTHWLGRGMQLSGYYQNIDRRHNGNIFFRVPFLNGSKFGFSASLLRYASTEPLFFTDRSVYFDYTNSSATLSGIYEINRAQTFEIGANYFIEDYKKDERHIGESTPGPDALRQPKLLGKAIYKRDEINYHFFYLYGFDNITNIQTVYNLDEKSFFHILLNDMRYFKRIGKKGNIGTRLRIGVSTNTDSPFAPFVLDSQVNIRGSGNRIDRGTAAVIFNVEYRYTIYEKQRLAAQVVGFSDIGNWRSPGGDLKELTGFANYRQFVGGGFRLINKKAFNAILRVDFGIDLYNIEERGVVLGIGQYF